MALCDLRLVYNPVTRRCDHAFNGTDFELDFSPVTPLLLALGCERRAWPDDELPDAQSDVYAPTSMNPRRGWQGDALDARGRRIGSRLWLLQRRKHDELTRRLGATAIEEALNDFATANRLALSVGVRWVARNVLGMKIGVAGITIDLHRPVGA